MAAGRERAARASAATAAAKLSSSGWASTISTPHQKRLPWSVGPAVFGFFGRAGWCRRRAGGRLDGRRAGHGIGTAFTGHRLHRAVMEDDGEPVLRRPHRRRPFTAGRPRRAQGIAALQHVLVGERFQHAQLRLHAVASPAEVA